MRALSAVRHVAVSKPGVTEATPGRIAGAMPFVVPARSSICGKVDCERYPRPSRVNLFRRLIYLFSSCGRDWNCSGQFGAFGPREQMLDRRGMPPRAAARGSLAHSLKLDGDLLERAVWCCCLDAGNQPDRPVVALLRLGAIEKAGLQNPFVGKTSHGASERLDRPVRGLPSV
jgi:hypothetical protein